MEQIQTRTEHSRSMEDADRLRAIHTLTEVGLLIPLAEAESFHGRVARPGEEGPWTVDPTFANGSNDSGNSNVNSRPTLYTGQMSDAKDFGDARATELTRPLYRQHFSDRVRNYSEDEQREWKGRLDQEEEHWWTSMDPEIKSGYLNSDYMVYRESQRLEQETPQDTRDQLLQEAQQGYQAEVHEIVSHDSDATVLDFNFDPAKLGDEAKQAYATALRALDIPVTEGSPVSFDARNEVARFVEVAAQQKTTVFTQENSNQLAHQAGINPDTALQLASAFNSRQVALVQPAYLAHKLIKNRAGIVTDSLELNGERQDVPLNLEYAERFFRAAHIVGVKQGISSDTLNRGIDAVSLFDLEAVNTAPHFEAQNAQTMRKLGSIAVELTQPVAEADNPARLLRALEDPHVKPERLVEYAKQIDGYAELFNADAGNWEGYTLAEHTETVLRNFDENYADKLPVEMLAPMRLMLLAHDLGKPKAVAHGAKDRENDYNLIYASSFFYELGIPDNQAAFLKSIIGDGVELAYQSEIRGSKSAVDDLRQLAIKSLKLLQGEAAPITEDQVDGYFEMSRILLTCDGGAYTSMAVTRPAEKGKGRYRNAASFNRSFAKPVGPGKRGLRLANRSDEIAPHDLTPQADANQSKLRMSQRGAGRKPPKL